MDRHSGESRKPVSSSTWTPAYAGVTDLFGRSLSSRVMLVMQLLEPFAGDMGIHLRR